MPSRRMARLLRKKTVFLSLKVYSRLEGKGKAKSKNGKDNDGTDMAVELTGE